MSNIDRLIRIPQTNLRPKIAIIGYGTSVEHGNDSHISYCESHTIYQLNNSFSFGAGQPVTQELMLMMGKFGKSLIKDENRKQLKSALYFKNGFFDNNILWCRQETHLSKPSLVWWEKAARRKMHFSERANVPTAEVNVPALVYRYSGGNMYVYVLKEDKAPKGKTDLYIAPFFNTSPDGSVCLGSTNTDVSMCSTWEETAEKLSFGFWQSEFSHTNTTTKEMFADNIPLLWKEQGEADTPFPLGKLKISKVKLRDLCR